eukprot:7165744-Prymnesium_polylepis.1
MARVRDARTTRAGSHAEVDHQAGAGTARGSVMQGSGMARGAVMQGSGMARGAVMQGSRTARGATLPRDHALHGCAKAFVPVCACGRVTC